VSAAPNHSHQPIDEIINEDKRSRLLTCALNRKANSLGVRVEQHPHAQDKLRDYVLPAHLGTIDVVRPDDEHTIESGAPIIDGHNFTDNFTGRIGIARVRGIGYY